MTSLSRSRPTTPIRRVSRGSISSHHRASVSAANSTSTPLSFLTQAISDLSYETSTLHSNLECIEEIDQALLTFDESFSMFLYGLRMNAFCVEWPEAPGEVNFERFMERKDQMRGLEKEMLRKTPIGQQSVEGYGDETTITVQGGSGPTGDQTYMTQDDDDDGNEDVNANVLRQNHIKPSTNAPVNKPPLKSALKKSSIDTASSSTNAIRSSAGSGPSKGRIPIAEKKKREAKAAEIIDSLPLEYRGSDPKPGQLATSVLLALMAAGKKGVRINEIIKMPELPQAKINKCMIALVTAKHVIKRSDNGIIYQLDPIRHGSFI